MLLSTLLQEYLYHFLLLFRNTNYIADNSLKYVFLRNKGFQLYRFLSEWRVIIDYVCLTNKGYTIYVPLIIQSYRILVLDKLKDIRYVFHHTEMIEKYVTKSPCSWICVRKNNRGWPLYSPCMPMRKLINQMT